MIATYHWILVLSPKMVSACLLPTTILLISRKVMSALPRATWQCESKQTNILG